MALISPILDNRTFDQLRDELVNRIPAYAPEWTDHNESEPGIALLELFAHLGEALLFRFNQIPDTTKLAFLRLLGVQPRPAQPASVLLAASTELPDGVQILEGTEARAGSLPFQTDNEVYVWPLETVAVGKVAAPTTDLTKAEEERRAAATAYAKVLEPVFYETIQVPEDPLAVGSQPLDVSQTLDQSVWIALLRKDTTDVAKLSGRTLFVGVAFDETIPTPFVLQALTAADADTFRSAGLDPVRTSGLGSDLPPMHWQIWNGPSASTPFTTLKVLHDTTGGMVSTGVVQLELPKALPSIDPSTSPSGGKDSPPPLTDEKQAANVVAWIQASRPSGSQDAIHKIRWVGLNAVSASQSRSAAPELLGTGTGDTDQSFPLAHHPVLRGTVQLQVEEVDGWHDWREVDDLLAVDPDDRAFAVDYAAGAVSFGQRLPQLGQRIRTLSYQYGGGITGNVPAGSITSVTGVGGVEVTNPLPAVGGSDTVSLNDALEKIPAEVHRHDRAVIAEDFRDFAEQLPEVIRAETLPLLHPDTPTVPAAGVVSVVVFPSEDLANPSAPMPDLALLRRVAKHLDARRLVTTELYVIPPTYKRVAVSAGVEVRNGYQVDAVRRWVELILRQYLAPVPDFGPDGHGWPLGRTIRRAELEAVAVQVEGVEYLNNLFLGEYTATGLVKRDMITFERWELPELVQITVVGGAPLPLGVGVEPPEPPKTPVPLPPEVC
jgi:predicted phage baseplate assembly protein